MELSERMDVLLGYLEWLKTEQLKTGGHKRVPEIEKISGIIETLSRKIDAWNVSSGTGGPEAGGSSDPNVPEMVARLQDRIATFTEHRQLPTSENLASIRDLLSPLEDFFLGEKWRQKESFAENGNGR